VRAAALALQGIAARRTFVARSTRRSSVGWRATTRRRATRAVALLEAAGASGERRSAAVVAVDLPAARGVALALGADVRPSREARVLECGNSFVVRLRGDVAPITAARYSRARRSGTTTVCPGTASSMTS
jgi:hypothetical protein